MEEKKKEDKARVLEGMRVLDFTNVLSGPYCTWILCCFGAEVIKIEQPDTGDRTRQIPFRKKGWSSYFIHWNCGKKSITLNLKNPKAQETVKELVKISDVVVENFRPGVMARLGLAYDDLKKVNPKIIMCSISGYGQNGPYASLPGFNNIAAAESGVAWLIAQSIGENAKPQGPGVAFADTVTSLFGVGAICAALFHRDRTGVGQYIDLGLLDSMVAVNDRLPQHMLSEGSIKRHLRTPVYAGRDGYLTATGKPEDLAKATGMSEFTDEKINTREKQIENREIVEQLLSGWLQNQNSVRDAVKTLKEAGIVAAPILDLDEVMAHPQLRAREAFVDLDHPDLGKIKLLNSPVKFSDAPGNTRGLPPKLGEHNNEVLGRLLGHSEEVIASLSE